MRDGDEPVLVHTAEYLVPVTGAPIAGGSVATRGGLILGFGRREDVLGSYDGAEEIRWDGVLMPGLVNAHAHLQYHGLAELGQSIHADFEAWSVAFDDTYAAIHDREDWAAAALAGAEDSIRAGITTVADICTDLAAVDALPLAGLSGVTYIETLGNAADRWWNGDRDRFVAAVRDSLISATSGFTIGVSPHAPYSLDTEVLADLAAIARTSNLRLHTHLAESTFEDAYYQTGTGPLADFVAGFGRQFKILLDGGAGQTAGEFARDLGLLGSDCHVAHGIYLNASDRQILRETKTAVALCPRSNAVIGLDNAPVAAYLEEGNHVCVGTDSLSSSPSLDLLEDVRALHDIAIAQGYDNADLSNRLLRAATIDGASALGMSTGDYRVGSLKPGNRANLAVFALNTTVENAEVDMVVHGAGTCRATIIDGAVVSPRRRTNVPRARE